MQIIPFCIGAGLGVAILIAAEVLRFSRDRSFYPTLLIVIASYYVLFAVMAGRPVVVEIVVATVFGIMAVASALRWRLLAGLGILLHGVFDFTRGGIVGDGGAPEWWPAFCGGIDVVLGVWLLGAFWFGYGRQRAGI